MFSHYEVLVDGKKYSLSRSNIFSVELVKKSR